MAALVPQQHLAAFCGASFHLQHLVHLERFEPRMRQIKRNRDRRHAFRREPFVAKVAIRPKCDAARGELVVKLAHSFFELVPLDPDPQIADANVEQLFVFECDPGGLTARLHAPIVALLSGGNTRGERFYNGISAVMGKGLGWLRWIMDTNAAGRSALRMMKRTSTHAPASVR